jgi:hypothetical protein
MRFIIRSKSWSLTFRLTSRILPYYHSWKSAKKRRLSGDIRSHHKNWKCLFLDVHYHIVRNEN